MKRQYLTRPVLVLLFGLPVVVTAEDNLQDQVLNCLAEVGARTDWNTCLNTMFAPCAGQEIGSEGHLTCLKTEREDWRLAKSAAEGALVDRLSKAGMQELSGLMLAWPKFVDTKCTAVAEGRADISYDAAQLGCQIAEIALMTNEFTACVEERSVEDYCQLEPQ